MHLECAWVGRHDLTIYAADDRSVVTCDAVSKEMTYLKNLIRVLQYAFAELEFVPYKSRYKKRSLDLQNRFIFSC